jgi:predicted DsbA family dithiol-disulfide isomerase
MHDLILAHQDELQPTTLLGYAERLGLDVELFTSTLREHTAAARVAEDVDSADLSGVSGTPTFFINGRRHYGAYDIAALTSAVTAVGARVYAAGTEQTSHWRWALGGGPAQTPERGNS